jgi:hypothetical protein
MTHTNNTDNADKKLDEMIETAYANGLDIKEKASVDSVNGTVYAVVECSHPRRSATLKVTISGGWDVVPHNPNGQWVRDFWTNAFTR